MPNETTPYLDRVISPEQGSLSVGALGGSRVVWIGSFCRHCSIALPELASAPLQRLFPIPKRGESPSFRASDGHVAGAFRYRTITREDPRSFDLVSTWIPVGD